ncbi:MAG: type II secretion system protein, partial [Clostridiales bacterium]|nr:type II secretion system protein [Clostridiales bacterium]
MQNNKGLTLVEIIVAMALLGIIAATFLSALSSHYVFISNTKEITEDAFTAQKDIEEQIKNIKANISEGNSVPGGIQVELFGRDVKGYPIEADINESKMIKTVVADSRMPTFTAPVASNVKLELYIDNTKLTKKHEYAIKPGLNIRSSADVDKKGVFLLNKHEWYVSKPGFHIPIVSTVNIDEDLDYGRLYPLFPNDYEAIPILTESNMMNSSKLQQIRDDYKGRHIIYAITPYAESGKKGKTILSEPVYLSGLPDLDNLILHLDSSLINKEDTNTVRAEGEQLYVKQWTDQSSQNNHFSSNMNNLQPILKEVQYQEDAFVWGKSLSPNSGSALLNITNFTPNEATRNMIFIMVAKGNVQNTSTDIL